MEVPDITALVALTISALIFILLASRVKGVHLTVAGYTLADRTIKAKHYGASFVAASTSLATVLLFFLNTANLYGITLIWCGCTYLLGQYLFVGYVRRVSNTIKGDIRTFSDLWYSRVKSSSSARWITTLTFTSFLIILFVELYVGSVIFSFFLSQMTGYARILAFLLTGTIVTLYVRLGGLKAVMQTDAWQLRVMILGIIALLLFSLVTDNAEHVNGISLLSLFAFKSDWSDILIFWFWILCLNLTIPFTQLSSWQRVASCVSTEEVWKGFKAHVISFLLVWILPVIAFVILSAKGYNYKVLDDLLIQLRNSPGISQGVFYPLVVVGFGAALFSTADTALIALVACIADENTFKDRLEQMTEKKLRTVFTAGSVLIMLIMTVTYYFAEGNIGAWFMPLIYNIFGQLAIIAPLMIYALVNLDKDQLSLTKMGNIILSTAIVIAWACILGSTFISQMTTNFLWSQLATPISMVVTALGLFVALRIGRVRQ